MKTAPLISLTEKERSQLTVWSRLLTPGRLALRAKIILLAADGESNRTISAKMRISSKTISLWRRRFAERRLAGVEKACPRGRRRSEAHEILARQIVEKTLHELPPQASRWTTRSLAKELGISPSLVHRVWKANGVAPYPELNAALPNLRN